MLLRSSVRDPRGFTTKLGDFGFAKLLTPGVGPEGRPGIVPEDASGTLPYMAPELFVMGGCRAIVALPWEGCAQVHSLNNAGRAPRVMTDPLASLLTHTPVTA